ncbi:ISAs1 family transposase [Marinicellulosiphila megalodicopiae]|uniref:ISAs1 family transposase n=1 Tax=Marinicellulosiphila megalodicopiae TaxID=2724896 RepID=UPI003BAFF779
MNSKNIFDQFSSITDFRQSGKIKHPLVNIITITLCATLCGADDWDSIEDYGHAKFEWLSSFLDMSSGVPSHDTISRVFSLLDPVEFQEKFILWVQKNCTDTHP